MEDKGFALVSCGQGINGAHGYAFLHRQTGEYIGVQEEELDEEEMWDVLGVTEEEIMFFTETSTTFSEIFSRESRVLRVGA